MANKWELEPNVERYDGSFGLKRDGEYVADIPDHLAGVAIEIARKLNVHDELIRELVWEASNCEIEGDWRRSKVLRELISRAEGHS